MTNIVAVDYKGKHFVLTDENMVDDMDFVMQHIDTDFILHNEDSLIDHVSDCNHYGIPAYVGESGELHARIAEIEKKLAL